LIGQKCSLEADLTWSPPATGKRGEARLRIEVTLNLGEECAILFGASGAGKTSILRLIAGLERPVSGRIQLGGETLFDSREGVNCPLRHRRIGLIFQDDLLFPHLNVRGNVRFGLKGKPRAESERRVQEVARLCGVEHLLERRPETLSGGERQRVGLARALAPRPRLLLCDEPVSALDMEARDVLVDRLKVVQRSEGMPLLYVTHSPAEAIALGSHLFLLEAGRVVDEGPPLDVLARSSGFSRAGVSNRFAATVDGQLDGADESHVRIEGGPTLVVPRLERPVGSSVLLQVRAEDILLARGPIVGLSARNLLEGMVERVIEHGSEAEVLVRTGGVAWIVSVVSPALTALGLCAGVTVHMIIKARSCRVIPTLDESFPKET
jgi:molybdate transport system ATP-binding protein